VSHQEKKSPLKIHGTPHADRSAPILAANSHSSAQDVSEISNFVAKQTIRHGLKVIQGDQSPAKKTPTTTKPKNSLVLQLSALANAIDADVEQILKL
jgi:hypothetical protein